MLEPSWPELVCRCWMYLMIMSPLQIHRIIYIVSYTSYIHPLYIYYIYIIIHIHPIRDKALLPSSGAWERNLADRQPIGKRSASDHHPRATRMGRGIKVIKVAKSPFSICPSNLLLVFPERWSKRQKRSIGCPSCWLGVGMMWYDMLYRI